MGIYKINIEKFGDEYLLVNWPQEISPKISENILQFNSLLHKEIKNDFIESNITYASLCIRFDPENISFEDLEKTLKVIYKGFNPAIKRNNTLWEIPVCYHPDLAPDLNLFCEKKNIEIDNLIEWHTKVIYRVYFLGFLPGFLYLGGLDERLYLPRRSTPRQSVPKGAVGIAGSQTGIYPQASPGGWNLIGRSPIELFTPTNNPPVVIQSGDEVKFKAIQFEEFKMIEDQVINKNFSLGQINS